MSHIIKVRPLVYFIATITMGFVSCKKDSSVETATTDSAIAIESTITVAAGSSLKTTDSVYIIHPCPRGTVRDSIAQSALPAAVSSYLNANYQGYNFNKAYAITSRAGVVTGYVTVIFFNDKPVGLAFDNNGNFVKVLEQREKGDLAGMGWHHGGRFEDRGGIKKDSVALNALPASITAYFSANYASDTLLKSFTNRDSSYLVFSKNNGLNVSLFDKTGNFVKRIELPSKPAKYKINEQANLSATISSYLNSSYPNYTLKKAYSLSLNDEIKAYIVIIDANNTRYALEFDASGGFVRVKTIF